MEMPGVTNGIQNSWATMLAFMGTDHGYDGVTYPSLNGMNYQQVLVQLATSEPGVWNLTATIRACGCTSDTSCDCIADPAGAYTDYQTCFLTVVLFIQVAVQIHQHLIIAVMLY